MSTHTDPYAVITAQDLVILVDEADEPVGIEDKLSAHRNGTLHRALSIFLFDSDGRMLLQRRAGSKYHTPGLLSNACCTHPKPGESIEQAAIRRLKEELGIAASLNPICSLLYRAEVDGLVEHEFDHVLAGRFDGVPSPDPAEVSEVHWSGVDEIAEMLRNDPDRFTPWFRIVAPTVVELWGRKTGAESAGLPRCTSIPGVSQAVIFPAQSADG